MASELMDALTALAREKKIDEIYLLEQLEKSLSKSYRQILDLEFEPRVTIERNTGKIYVFEMVPVGEPDEETGEYAEFEERDVTPSNVSRIAAQNVKKFLTEILRDHERLELFNEFEERIGELVSGQVLQVTKDFTILKIRDGVEAELPHFNLEDHPEELNEKPANERYRHNQRLKALIIDVHDPSDMDNVAGQRTRPLIVVSRTNPDFIKKLFEMEVPEIYEGVVQVKAIAREPGARSKVAVASRERNLDPVGACVGPRGSRVRMVVEELHNERVDVIAYSEDPAVYVANALSPAKVMSVTVDPKKRWANVIVADDQVKLAIGKEGQNARLAARLTQWHIDIKSASLAKQTMGADLLLDEDVAEEEDNDGRCTFVLENGARCRNHARPGSKFCGVHDEMQQ